MAASLTGKRRARTDGYHRPTIGDVALLAGVHPTTVSAVLNNRPNCYASARTRERIHDAAARLEYRPNALARALGGKRTATMGMVVTGLESEPSSRKFVGFETQARAHRQVTLIASTHNEPELEDQAIRSLMDRAVDALAIYPTEEGEHVELRKLVERGFPVVTFDGAGRIDLPCDDVSPDPFEAGRLQGEHLVACGRRRIGAVQYSQTCWVTRRKVAGVNQALADAGLGPALPLVIQTRRLTDYMLETDELDQLRGLIGANRNRLDAVAAVGDMAALAVLRVAGELGLRVPEDLAVIGIDGLVASKEGFVPLSTVGHDAEEVGRLAYALLTERLAGNRTDHRPRRVTVPVVLKARVSTLGRGKGT